VLGGIAEKHGLAIIAASTHPFADWSQQHFTQKERYLELARDLQGVGKRMLICGIRGATRGSARSGSRSSTIFPAQACRRSSTPGRNISARSMHL